MKRHGGGANNRTYLDVVGGRLRHSRRLITLRLMSSRIVGMVHTAMSDLQGPSHLRCDAPEQTPTIAAATSLTAELRGCEPLVCKDQPTWRQMKGWG
jgi:hypothetical protein